MKRYLGFLLPLLLALSAVAQPPPMDLAKPHGPTAAATAFLDLLVKGEFQTAVQNFAEPMKAATPPAKLAQIWSALQIQMGPYKRRIATRAVKEGLYDVVLATTGFERGTADLKVVLDERGRIAGFFVVPAEPKQEPGRIEGLPPVP
jgi:Protein of unknown function (DUF3887)